MTDPFAMAKLLLLTVFAWVFGSMEKKRAKSAK
jgi:hypothetical protein